MNKIFLCFKNDLTATQAADICGVNRNTVNRYYGLLRRAILSESIREARQEIGEYELDESYFGARRVRGKRGREAAGKTPVVVLAKTGLLAGRRYTCYPGMEESLAQWCGGADKARECTAGATLVPGVPFVHDGNVLTGRGPGTAEQYAMEFVRLLSDENTRDKVAAGACQRGYEKPTAL